MTISPQNTFVYKEISMKLSNYTVELLNDIENRINPDAEEDYIRQWESFWDNKFTKPIFSPKRKTVSAPKIEIKPVHINDALLDYELMLDMQMESVSNALAKGKQALSMRANYGTGIIGSLFGAEIFTMPREQKTLPTVRAFNDTDKIRSLTDAGVPNLNFAFGKNVFEFGEYCASVFKDYPKISKYVYMMHPDTQGPLDIAELLWGGEMFYAMYEDPDLVHGFMKVITETYVKFLEKWFATYPNRERLNVHWDFWMKGAIVLRDDSAMNISPDFYREFAYPYDKYLLDHFGGGVVHFCGRGDHYIDILTSIDSLSAINLSQPHLNDMEKIYNSAFSNGKKILKLRDSACNEYNARPNSLNGMISNV